MLSERQQQIIESSVELIDKKGIQGFTIKNLSKELGISEPGIYRHFESKFDILNTILEIFKLQLKEYQELLKNNNNPPRERIIGFFDSVFMAFDSNPAIVSVIFAEEIFQNEERLTKKIDEIQGLNSGIMKELLQEINAGSNNAQDVDLDLVNMILHGSVRFLVRQWKSGGYNFDLRKKGRELVSFIINTTL